MAGRGFESVLFHLIIIIVLAIISIGKIEKEWVHKLVVTAWFIIVVATMIVNWNEWLISR